MPDDQLQAAVDRANEAIQAFMRMVSKDPENWTERQHGRYVTLLAAYNRARAARDATRAREADPEPEPAAA